MLVLLSVISEPLVFVIVALVKRILKGLLHQQNALEGDSINISAYSK